MPRVALGGRCLEGVPHEGKASVEDHLGNRSLGDTRGHGAGALPGQNNKQTEILTSITHIDTHHSDTFYFHILRLHRLPCFLAVAILASCICPGAQAPAARAVFPRPMAALPETLESPVSRLDESGYLASQYVLLLTLPPSPGPEYQAYQSLFTDLESPGRATVRRAFTYEIAMRLHTSPEGHSIHPIYNLVLITDEALANNTDYALLWDAVLAYVRAGGTAVVLGRCAYLADRDKVGTFFAKAGLSWEVGNMDALGSFHLNTSVVGELGLVEQLPTSYYHQNNLMVQGVLPGDILYSPTCPNNPLSPNQPTFDETRLPGLASAALARVGDGKLGYLGDLYSNESTIKIVYAMCGLRQNELGVVESRPPVAADIQSETHGQL